MASAGRVYSHPPEYLVAVDPGVAKCGLAFARRGEVVEAITLHRPTPAAVYAWLVSKGVPIANTTFVREKMYYYPHLAARHANLDMVEDWADDVASALGITWSRAWDAPTWKGPLPKEAHHARVASVLRDTEKWVWTHPATSEDGRDAIGILLFSIGRILRNGITPTPREDRRP